MKVDAIYQAGVFRPLADVPLPNNQRVRLSIETLDGADALAWLTEVRQLQQQIITQRGYFPDSSADIANDRTRDE